MSNLMPHQQLLLIIDEAPPDQNFVDYFAQFDFQIIQTTKLPQCIDQLQSFSAIIISWTLIQGESAIINDLYQKYSIPIIIVSNTNDEKICVRLLEAGADDFLTKPIIPRELHARICAINRRIQRTNQPPIHNEKETLTFGNWRVYPASKQLFHEYNEIFLSIKEFNLLLAFVRQPQKILDREFLSHITQSTIRNALDRRVDGQICRLRQKIEVDAKKPVLIKTIRNNGYLFTPQVLSTKE